MKEFGMKDKEAIQILSDLLDYMRQSNKESNKEIKAVTKGIYALDRKVKYKAKAKKWKKKYYDLLAKTDWQHELKGKDFDDAVKMFGSNTCFPYVVGQRAEMRFGDTWYEGKIVEGYRFRDGIVTIELDNGHRVWCGEARTDLYRPLNRLDMEDKK